MTLALSIPLGVTMQAALQQHLDASLAANQAADAVNYDWWQEFQSQASGLATTFTPSILGFAAVLDNVGRLLDRRLLSGTLVGVVTAYLLVWTFVSGGIIDRFARQRPTRAHGFFASSGVFFFRFLRLFLAAALVYSFLFAVVYEWLFSDLFRAATRDVDAERIAFAWRLAVYVVFGALLVAVNVVFDFARIRAVVEDRRSMLLALVASARFVRRNPGRVLGLYGLNAAAFLLVIAVWGLAAPGARGGGPWIWLSFIVAQVYVTARLFLKLHFIASETALFQTSLAHAGYTARPAAAWPESPAAEAIRTPELT